MLPTIVARIQAVLFWLFDLRLQADARQGCLQMHHPIKLLLTHLWVRLIGGDVLMLNVCPRHDLTHLALGLGASPVEEILVDISHRYLFGRAFLPDLAGFEREFISAWNVEHRDLGLSLKENCLLLLEEMPRVARVHQRLNSLCAYRAMLNCC